MVDLGNHKPIALNSDPIGHSTPVAISIYPTATAGIYSVTVKVGGTSYVTNQNVPAPEQGLHRLHRRDWLLQPSATP